jgi:vacuole morphology and inheritance protein 14
VAIPNHVQIQKLVKVLGTDFALSQNSNMRKGGLIGLAAMAIALGKVTDLNFD